MLKRFSSKFALFSLLLDLCLTAGALATAEYLRGTLSQILAALADRNRVKGECTLLVAGRQSGPAVSDERLEAEIRSRLSSARTGVGAMAREISRELGISKKLIYEKALKIKNERP